MKRQQTTPGYSEWIWIPVFRRCQVSDDKVEVTHPIIYGRGFLFDGLRRMVTIRRCLLGKTLSEEEIPFSDVTIRLRRVVWNAGRYAGGGYFIEMTARGGAKKVYEVANPMNSKRGQRILAAIAANRKLGL